MPCATRASGDLLPLLLPGLVYPQRTKAAGQAVCVSSSGLYVRWVAAFSLLVFPGAKELGMCCGTGHKLGPGCTPRRLDGAWTTRVNTCRAMLHVPCPTLHRILVRYTQHAAGTAAHGTAWLLHCWPPPAPFCPDPRCTSEHTLAPQQPCLAATLQLTTSLPACLSPCQHVPHGFLRPRRPLPLKAPHRACTRGTAAHTRAPCAPHVSGPTHASQAPLLLHPDIPSPTASQRHTPSPPPPRLLPLQAPRSAGSVHALLRLPPVLFLFHLAEPGPTRSASPLPAPRLLPLQAP